MYYDVISKLLYMTVPSVLMTVPPVLMTVPSVLMTVYMQVAVQSYVCSSYPHTIQWTENENGNLFHSF